MLRALIVDDDKSSLRALTQLVKNEGFVTVVAANLQEARGRLQVEPPDLILIDLMLPDGSGLDLVADLGEDADKTSVVVITGHASVDTAVEALRRGASDYLTKPVDVARLKTVLVNVARTHELKVKISELRGQLRELGRFGEMVGGSPPMQQVYDLISKVAPTDATVLVVGESGTGKELVAQTLHALSRRANKPFLAVNCGAISPNLIESELFGHERGSFTGADRQHRGYFERADGGTLLLDEISEMPSELQVKLLRVLETNGVPRVGGDKLVRVDVRVIAATNRDLEAAVAEGKFRQDLLYRLKVFPIPLPPLRDRGNDVLALAEFFLDELNREHGARKRFTDPAYTAIAAHRWPGNVRELKNVVHRAFILAEDKIGPEALPSEIGQMPERAGAATDGLRLRPGTPLADMERRLIELSLDHFGGDKRKTAEALGISLKTLYNRLNESASAGST
jgi:two-component system response regulator AtoC